MDRREQATDAAARRNHLAGEVIIEAAEHAEFRDPLFRELDRSERVREGPAGFRDAAHRERRMVSDQDPRGLRDRDGERTNRHGLIYHVQQRSVVFQTIDERTQ